MRRNSFVFLLVVIVLMVFVLAAAPDWINGASDVNYTTVEETPYYHNFSLNITGFANDVNFSIDTATDIVWTGSLGVQSVTPSEVSDWIYLSGGLSEYLTIDVLYDNQTGFFEIPIQATNLSTGATVEDFEFQINATNDVPDVINLISEYNFTQDIFSSETVNAVDEESHYPLRFDLAWINNCTHATWSGRSVGENCSIFNLTSVTNASAEMNMTATHNDVGVYWANITIMDAGENYNCPHVYCENATYEVNKSTSVYVVKFNVFSSLTVNVSNCTGQVLTEGQPFSCHINITTRGEDDVLNASSYADFKTWGGAYYESNRDWFYAENLSNASNFAQTAYINFTPTKREVGNWTINFSVIDYTIPDSSFPEIDIFVNWTEDGVVMNSISDISIYFNDTFAVDAFDEDLLIADGSVKAEVVSFDSNTSWVTIESEVNGFGNNYTRATVKVNYDYIYSVNSTDANYSILINATDAVGNSDSEVFTVEILTDNAADWNLSKQYNFSINEDNSTWGGINLSDYVNDTDGDVVFFHYSNNTPFDNFNLSNASGNWIINFTPSDVDVGNHLVTLYADDGKLNSSEVFNFTINNIVDSPFLGAIASPQAATEDTLNQISLDITDQDFLIPAIQNATYNETLTFNLTFTNLTVVTTPISFTFTLSVAPDSGGTATYLAEFTPDGIHVGDYNVTVNVTDAGGSYNSTYFILNITESNDDPNLTAVSNYVLTSQDIFYVDINASDQEDGNDTAGVLNFTLVNITGNDILNIGLTTGVINQTLNESVAGYYEYNLSVNDSAGAVDWQIFTLTIYGTPNITSPGSSYEFLWKEANATGDLDFEVDYAVNDTNLTYKIYMDKIVYSNLTMYNYTTLISAGSLRNATNFTWVADANFTWNFTSGYDDEGYGKWKNLTLLVYNPSYPELNQSINWKVNITHTNQNLTIKDSAYLSDKGPIPYGTDIDIDLYEYFEDADYWDKTINQTINFTLETINGSGLIEASSETAGVLVDNSWVITLKSFGATTDRLTITAYEYDSSNVLIGNVTSNEFEVEFIVPPVVPTPTPRPSSGGSGSSTTKLERFSIKLIFPRDIVVSEDNYIDVPFAVWNTGSVDLASINLRSIVKFNNEFSDNVKISLGTDYIDTLTINESKDFAMRISADTHSEGKYTATVFANVGSPKFEDWGDFTIDVRKINESEAEHILIFTEQFIADNPECLELTELVRTARVAFEDGDYTNSIRIAEEATAACEISISANEQIQYGVEGFVRDNFYYISFLTLIVFVVGFVFYVYKRVKFNKYREDEYIEGTHR